MWAGKGFPVVHFIDWSLAGGPPGDGRQLAETWILDPPICKNVPGDLLSGMLEDEDRVRKLAYGWGGVCGTNQECLERDPLRYLDIDHFPISCLLPAASESQGAC